MTESGGVFRRWTIRYALEYGAALVAYLGSIFLCVPAALRAADPGRRVLLVSVPAAASLLLAVAVVRHFRRIDEFLRKRLVESLAVAGAVTGVWTLAYGFFELAGCPRPSAWWVLAGVAVAMNAWFVWHKLFRR